MRWKLVASLAVAVFSTLCVQGRAIGDLFNISGGHFSNNWGPTCCAFLEPSRETPYFKPDVLLFDGFGSATGSVFATPGKVGGSLSGSFNAPLLQTRFFDPKITAMTAGTVMFSGEGPFVTMPMTLHMQGVLSIRAFPPSPNPFTHASGVVTFTHTMMGVESTFGAGVIDHTGLRLGVTDNEDFSGVTSVVVDESTVAFGNHGTTKHVFTVPTGVPVPVIFKMELGFLHRSNGFLGFSQFEGNFAHTFSWARGRPVFDLPPGYTVNGMGIVDNFYVIPEPASWVLLLLAAAGGYLRRGRTAAEWKP